jgi:hypothetical protein
MARGKKKVRCGDQECHDAFYGIIRDNDGDVISEGQRYYIKGAAQCTDPK